MAGTSKVAKPQLPPFSLACRGRFYYHLCSAVPMITLVITSWPHIVRFVSHIGACDQPLVRRSWPKGYSIPPKTSIRFEYWCIYSPWKARNFSGIVLTALFYFRGHQYGEILINCSPLEVFRMCWKNRQSPTPPVPKNCIPSSPIFLWCWPSITYYGWHEGVPIAVKTLQLLQFYLVKVAPGDGLQQLRFLSFPRWIQKWPYVGTVNGFGK